LKFRAKLAALLILAVMLVTTAFAGGFGGLFGETAELPDPTELAGSEPVFYGEDVIADGVAYCGYAYAMPDDMDKFLAEYTVLAEEAGYSVVYMVIDTIEDVESVPAWQISAGLLNAYIIPEYRGCMMFLVNPMLDCILLPTAEPTPAPTSTPAARPTSGPVYPGTAVGSGGHWEYIEVQQDCFACVGGVCDLCDGTGTYRMYGSAISCSKTCETCGGLGYWFTTQAVWVQ